MKSSRSLLLCSSIVLLAACSFQKPAADEWGCSFGKGPFDNKELKNVIPPGRSGGLSNDTLVIGPADHRAYIIDSDPTVANFGAEPVVLVAQGPPADDTGVVDVSVEAQINFVFNERFCDWYVNHGSSSALKGPALYNRSPQDESAWQSVLRTSIYEDFVDAARPVIAAYSYADLFADRPGSNGRPLYDEVSNRIAERLSEELEANLGNVYFCGPSYEFDGRADGVLDSGCPDLEVSVKRVAPVDRRVRSTLEAVAVAHEQILVVEAQRALELAEAQADLDVSQAREAVAQQEQLNAELDAVGASAFCRQLADAGVDCALLAAAENGADSTFIVDPTGDTALIIDTDPAP